MSEKHRNYRGSSSPEGSRVRSGFLERIRREQHAKKDSQKLVRLVDLMAPADDRQDMGVDLEHLKAELFPPKENDEVENWLELNGEGEEAKIVALMQEAKHKTALLANRKTVLGNMRFNYNESVNLQDFLITGAMELIQEENIKTEREILTTLSRAVELSFQSEQYTEVLIGERKKTDLYGYVVTGFYLEGVSADKVVATLVTSINESEKKQSGEKAAAIRVLKILCSGVTEGLVPLIDTEVLKTAAQLKFVDVMEGSMTHSGQIRFSTAKEIVVQELENRGEKVEHPDEAAEVVDETEKSFPPEVKEKALAIRKAYEEAEEAFRKMLEKGAKPTDGKPLWSLFFDKSKQRDWQIYFTQMGESFLRIERQLVEKLGETGADRDVDHRNTFGVKIEVKASKKNMHVDELVSELHAFKTEYSRLLEREQEASAALESVTEDKDKALREVLEAGRKIEHLFESIDAVVTQDLSKFEGSPAKFLAELKQHEPDLYAQVVPLLGVRESGRSQTNPFFGMGEVGQAAFSLTPDVSTNDFWAAMGTGFRPFVSLSSIFSLSQLEQRLARYKQKREKQRGIDEQLAEKVKREQRQLIDDYIEQSPEELIGTEISDPDFIAAKEELDVAKQEVVNRNRYIEEQRQGFWDVWNDNVDRDVTFDSLQALSEKLKQLLINKPAFMSKVEGQRIRVFAEAGLSEIASISLTTDKKAILRPEEVSPEQNKALIARDQSLAELKELRKKKLLEQEKLKNALL